jgi:hypothetical protein
VNVRPDRSFDGDSAVGAYWLSRCEGFTVRAGRRELGVVEEVTCTEPIGLARSLLVRGARKRRIDSADVVAVIPARQVLVVRPRAETARVVQLAARTGPAAARGGRRLLTVGRTGVSLLALVVSSAAEVVAALARWLWPIVQRGSRRGARAGRRGSVAAARLAWAWTRRAAVWLEAALRRARERIALAIEAVRSRGEEPDEPLPEAESAFPEPTP